MAWTKEQMAEYQQNWAKTPEGRASSQASAKRWRSSPNGRAFYKHKNIQTRVKRRNFLRDAKSGPCEDCGIRHPWYVMDFDHVRGVKKFELNMVNANNYSLDTLLEEIAKCDLVCSNCHRARTWKRAQ